jgi:hypothetical protein
VPSNVTGTSLQRSRPFAASSRTQSDSTEVRDQYTMTASQLLSAASMDFANSAPPSISASHQTLSPAASNAAASFSAAAGPLARS